MSVQLHRTEPTQDCVKKFFEPASESRATRRLLTEAHETYAEGSGFYSRNVKPLLYSSLAMVSCFFEALTFFAKALMECLICLFELNAEGIAQAALNYGQAFSIAVKLMLALPLANAVGFFFPEMIYPSWDYSVELFQTPLQREISEVRHSIGREQDALNQRLRDRIFSIDEVLLNVAPEAPSINPVDRSLAQIQQRIDLLLSRIRINQQTINQLSADNLMLENENAVQNRRVVQMENYLRVYHKIAWTYQKRFLSFLNTKYPIQPQDPTLVERKRHIEDWINLKNPHDNSIFCNFEAAWDSLKMRYGTDLDFRAIDNQFPLPGTLPES